MEDNPDWVDELVARLIRKIEEHPDTCDWWEKLDRFTKADILESFSGVIQFWNMTRIAGLQPEEVEEDTITIST